MAPVHVIRPTQAHSPPFVSHWSAKSWGGGNSIPSSSPGSRHSRCGEHIRAYQSWCLPPPQRDLPLEWELMLVICNMNSSFWKLQSRKELHVTSDANAILPKVAAFVRHTTTSSAYLTHPWCDSSKLYCIACTAFKLCAWRGRTYSQLH